MPRKSKVLLGILLVAIALVAISATSAFAAPAYSVSLGISRVTGAYGQEFVITPTLNGTETVVGDTYTLQALQPDGVSWANFGEGLKVDETGTVVPQFVSVDETFLPWYNGIWQPTQFKVIYKTPRSVEGSPSAQIAYAGDNVVSFSVKSYGKVKWIPSIPKTVKRNRMFAIAGFTGPNAGIGRVAITISRSGFKTLSYKVLSDDSGYVSLNKKLGKRGKFTIRMRWLGNAFGPASGTTTSHVTVR